MKHSIYILGILILIISGGCKKDFLERLPQDKPVDETYWTNENNVRTFAYGFYTNYFSGYGSSFAFGKYFSGQSLNDDFAPSSPAQFTTVAPPTGGGWNFNWVRKANIMINRVQTVPMEQEAINHWTGVARFFRALEYHELVKSFGDVPWFGKELNENSDELYKPRDSRILVMDSVLSDFKYAAENVRESDGTDGLTVNKYVVLAFMSRVFLFEGTYLKYHDIDQTKAQEYLEAAKSAAEQVISSGRYTISDNYRSVFNSLDLSTAKEVILYREYTEGIVMHSLHSYVNKEPQTGASKNAIETYLASDGLPISISPEYQGDKTITDVMTNRDPRITETFVTELRLNGVATNYSTSGYAVNKFYNETIKDLPAGNSNTNTTDAPIIRYGEVLINYAEAAAELGGLTQADLDMSINVLRKRPGIELPDLKLIGDQPGVGTTAYDDPKRDQTVPAMIWEIRRERRVELMMEGFRLDDLKRWKKLDYTDTENNADINRGAWINLADYPGLKDVTLADGGSEGYIIPAFRPETQRLFTDPRVYLEPLPLDQIQLFKDKGVELTQNPGW